MIEKIKSYKENKQRVRLFRKFSKNRAGISNGYILDFSEKFILLHETDDFRIDGYSILPIEQIKKLRFNKSDKYFDKMMKWENQTEKVGINYFIDLNSWESVFKSLQTKEINVIVECEGSDVNSFTIGPITKIGKKHVHLIYFDAEGFFEKSSSSIDYDSITRVAFDSQYLNIFSKYTRHRKA